MDPSQKVRRSAARLCASARWRIAGVQAVGDQWAAREQRVSEAKACAAGRGPLSASPLEPKPAHREPRTGKPDAGNLPVRFGREGERYIRSSYPHPLPFAKDSGWRLSRFGAGGGTRTRTTFYGPRILSPVRLPFRHTGESLAPVSDCNCGDERLWHRVAPMPSGPNCGQASRPKSRQRQLSSTGNLSERQWTGQQETHPRVGSAQWR